MVGDVNQMLADRDLHVTVPQNVKEKLVELGYNPKMGARPLRRVIQEHIEDQIADFVLEHNNDHRLVAQLNDDGEIVVTAESSQNELTKPTDGSLTTTN